MKGSIHCLLYASNDIIQSKNFLITKETLRRCFSGKLFRWVESRESTSLSIYLKVRCLAEIFGPFSQCGILHELCQAQAKISQLSRKEVSRLRIKRVSDVMHFSVWSKDIGDVCTQATSCIHVILAEICSHWSCRWQLEYSSFKLTVCVIVCIQSSSFRVFSNQSTINFISCGGVN